MSKFSHIIARIIANMDVAPSPPLPTTLTPPKFKMLGPPQYYQKIFYKFDFSLKFFMFSFSDLFILPFASITTCTEISEELLTVTPEPPKKKTRR